MTLNKSLAGWGLLIVLGLNLRPILSSISPLLGEIRLATGLSFQSSALLTSLPVICMGLVALVGVRVEAQLGERRGIALGLMMILLACLARWLMGQGAALLVTALLGGAGVALIQALVPAMIKPMRGLKPLNANTKCLWFITREIWSNKLNVHWIESRTRPMVSVKSVAILLAKLDYKYFHVQHFVWFVSKRRNDAELNSA